MRSEAPSWKKTLKTVKFYSKVVLFSWCQDPLFWSGLIPDGTSVDAQTRFCHVAGGLCSPLRAQVCLPSVIHISWHEHKCQGQTFPSRMFDCSGMIHRECLAMTRNTEKVRAHVLTQIYSLLIWFWHYRNDQILKKKKSVRFYLGLCGNDTKERPREMNCLLIAAPLIRCNFSNLIIPVFISCY